MVTATDLSDVVFDIDEPGRSGSLHGLFARPRGEVTVPGVVVIHEAFGVTEEMKDHVRRLAAMGYAVIMPDLFSDGGARKCLVATFRALRSGSGRAFADIETARRWLAARDDVAEKIGVIGFCMGGGFALLTARGEFAAASINYGMLPKDLDAAVTGACPIVGSFGGRDRTLPRAAERLRTALDDAGVPYDIEQYVDAGHAFLNERASGPRWAQSVLRVQGIGPDPVAAASAWKRIDAFFDRYLGSR